MKNYKIIKDRKLNSYCCCGRVSRNHLESIENHQDKIDLVSICDVEKVLSKYQSKYKVKGYLDLNEMLLKEDLDLVAICTLVAYMQTKQIMCQTWS